MDATAIDPFVFRLSIFVLAIFVGYFVVWSVTPALHTPLMSVTNAISSVIVVGALIAVGVSTIYHPSNIVISVDNNSNITVNGKPVALANVPPAEMAQRVDAAAQASAPQRWVQFTWTSKILGFFALILASVNIFGGFLVTSRMLAMYKKKEK
jgi:H+-translocating NAD(P) transhydrogenase subunit alpha